MKLNKLELLKEVRSKTLEKIINKFSTGYGRNLGDMKLSIWDAKEIIYNEVNKLSKMVFEEDFLK